DHHVLAVVAHEPTAVASADGTVAPIRSSRWSPTRTALAIAVSAGFTAPMLGKKLVSTTYRLSSSWALQLASSTDVCGSDPNRTVPAWWAQPAIGISFFRYALWGSRWWWCMSRSASIDL